MSGSKSAPMDGNVPIAMPSGTEMRTMMPKPIPTRVSVAARSWGNSPLDHSLEPARTTDRGEGKNNGLTAPLPLNAHHTTKGASADTAMSDHRSGSLMGSRNVQNVR